jgi:hypothetical protein
MKGHRRLNSYIIVSNRCTQKVQKKIFHENGNQKQAEIAILISEKSRL